MGAGVCWWRSLQPAWVGTGNVEWGRQGKKMIRRDGSRLVATALERLGVAGRTARPMLTADAHPILPVGRHVPWAGGGRWRALAGGVPPAFVRHGPAHAARIETPHMYRAHVGHVICGFSFSNLACLLLFLIVESFY